MSQRAHRLYISILFSIVIASVFVILYEGYSYYFKDIDQRYFHADHINWKPSGFIGHGLGIFGSFFMLVGVFGYMARKRIRRFSRLGILKHWLEAHIFLCTIGPFFILFHTTFKFGGIVSISFWSMVAVALSGVIGRFIYIQIPKTIEGRQLSKHEIEAVKIEAQNDLIEKYNLDRSILEVLNKKSDFENHADNTFADKDIIKIIKKELVSQQINKAEQKQIIRLVKKELTLNSRIKRLELMQKLFEYWHVVHLPFAILMLVIMIVHIVVALLFGYQWIF